MASPANVAEGTACWRLFPFYKCDSSVYDCKFRSYYVIFTTLQQMDSLMNEFLSYIIINEINFAAQQSPTCPIDNNSFRMLHIENVHVKNPIGSHLVCMR